MESLYPPNNNDVMWWIARESPVSVSLLEELLESSLSLRELRNIVRQLYTIGSIKISTKNTFAKRDDILYELGTTYSLV